MLSRFLLLTVLLAFSFMACGQSNSAYKCVNSTGKIEYSALPIAGADCSSLRVSRTPSKEAEEEKLAEEEKVEEKKPDEASTEPQTAEAQRIASCEKVRKNLELLQSDAKLTRTDDDGKEVLMDAESRAKALEQAEKNVEYWCE